MSKRQKRVRIAGETIHAVDRRTMMERSAAALATAVCCGLAGAHPASAQAQGAAPRVRRVVSGHNARGKSYVVSDDMVRIDT